MQTVGVVNVGAAGLWLLVLHVGIWGTEGGGE